MHIRIHNTNKTDARFVETLRDDLINSLHFKVGPKMLTGRVGHTLATSFDGSNYNVT